ncbi:MAG TPA: 30S ribosomal protein S1 [Syntrophales bacterium]|nr:30S ribosomal protein S1 [Syntrophales bacterium]HQN78876.1 30S ribosomal protein S1 [Syntrophales bacterium]HQQ26442.1 30S ribosomal protein S1 [Syntrophales bacterium]
MSTEQNEMNEELKNSQAMEDQSLQDSAAGDEVEESMSFVDLFEQSLQQVPYGEILTGRVVQINPDFIMVDVGYKTEGQVRTSEFTDREGNIGVAVGDDIEVLVERRAEDSLILSRNKAIALRVWDDIKRIYEAKETISGKIVERVKGGFAVDIGLLAFLPGSQVSLLPLRDFERMIGQSMEFHILKYDRKKNNVVVSRKTVIEKEQGELKRQTLEKIEEGKVMDGVVKNITEYGAFIDLGGIDGLLHITDMSWGRIQHPSEFLKKGDPVSVKILSFDREKERVSLGLKQLTNNPWDNIAERYVVDSIVEGRVVNILDYGAFVELESGVEGLVHISEMFWTKKMKHPSRVLSVGDTISVKILEVDGEGKRISLGWKQTLPNPWETLAEKYPVGSVVSGKIRNITDFGIFVGIDDQIDGLVHVSDISWRKRIKHPGELYRKGQEIQAVVLSVDRANEKFSLGIKQMDKNPWEELQDKYGVGGVVSGKVTNITDFGIFVEIEEGIEGLVHVSELSHKKVKSPKEVYQVGNEVTAVIKNIDTENKRVGLSIKDYESSSDSTAVKNYVDNKEKITSSLGKALANLKLNI